MRDGGLNSIIMATRLAPADEAAWDRAASRVRAGSPSRPPPPVIPTLCVWHMGVLGPSCGGMEGHCS
jgi:hypothetical protein